VKTVDNFDEISQECKSNFSEKRKGLGILEENKWE
jgi:hypothetical protein